MADPVAVTETEISLVKYLGGLAVTALGTLLALVYNKHEKDFDKLEVRVDKVEDNKADKADTEKRLDKGADKFDELLGEIRGLRGDIAGLNAHVVSELAQRPTRAEVVQMLQQSGH